MTVAFELLMLAALLGAVDVGYYHLYKFRLYARPESVAEELTHLARHVLFLAITAVMVLNLEPASTILRRSSCSISPTRAPTSSSSDDRERA